MRLSWTQEANDDRRVIYDFVEADNPAAALSLDELFSECASRLINYPYIGRVGRIETTRELVAHQNYVLIYDVVDDLVRVLRVIHAAKQWP